MTTESIPATVFTNPVYLPMYVNQTSAGHPIFTAVPCGVSLGYSDVLAVQVAVVSSDTPFDYVRLFRFRNATQLVQQYVAHPTGEVVNWPIVPPGSTFVDTSPANEAGAALLYGWYQLSERSKILNGLTADTKKKKKKKLPRSLARARAAAVFFGDFGDVGANAIVSPDPSQAVRVVAGNSAQVFDADTGSTIGDPILDVVAGNDGYSGLYL
ncbi:hypothetical protein HDU83_005910 [Entophlyctis luteolus]|nr:hypothetical protein HDU83_005910 [Entophlyctis luteolus]